MDVVAAAGACTGAEESPELTERPFGACRRPQRLLLQRSCPAAAAAAAAAAVSTGLTSFETLQVEALIVVVPSPAAVLVLHWAAGAGHSAQAFGKAVMASWVRLLAVLPQCG